MASGDMNGTGPWLDDLQAQLEGMLLDATKGLASQMAEFARQRVEAALREDRARRIGGAVGVDGPAPKELVGRGSVLEAQEAASIFSAPDRLSPVGRLAKGDLVEAAGPSQELEGGRVVLPIIKPAGAVDVGLLAHRPELRASYVVKLQKLDIFKTPTSMEAEGELMQGDRVESAGTPMEVQGTVMLPIAPKGAVELCFLDVEYVERRAPAAAPAPHVPPPVTRQADSVDEYSKLLLPVGHRSRSPVVAEPSEVHSMPVSEDAALDIGLQSELEELRRDAEILQKQVDRTGGSAQARHLADAAAERYREAFARARSHRSATQLYRGVPRAQGAHPGSVAPITEPLPERADMVLTSGISQEALQSRRALLSKNEELGRRLEGMSSSLQGYMHSSP